MNLTRQLGFYAAQVEFYKNENVLSEIQDLDYLRSVESRISGTAKELYQRGLVSENPLEELKNHYLALAKAHSLAKEIRGSSDELVVWISNRKYIYSKILEYKKLVSLKTQCLIRQIDDLNGLTDFCQSSGVWNDELKICPYIAVYSVFIEDDFGGADTDGDGFLSFNETEEKKSKDMYLVNDLRSFVSNQIGFVEGIKSTLESVKFQIDEIEKEYLELYELFVDIDQKLNAGDFDLFFSMRDTIGKFPELRSAVENKLQPVETLKTKFFDLEQGFDSFLHSQKIPFFLLFDKKEIVDSFDILTNKMSEAQQLISILPVGCQEYFQSSWRMMIEKLSSVERIIKRIHAKKRLSWIVCFTIIGMLSLFCILKSLS